MTIFKNKAVETVPAPQPQPSAETLQSRVMELRDEVQRIETELSAARASVRIAEGSVSAAENDCVVTGDAQTLRSAHEGHQAALRSVVELSDLLAQTKRLVGKAGEMLEESQRSEQEKYRRELEDRGRAGLRQFLEYLAALVEASQAFVTSHQETFDRFPRDAPAAFLINTNLIQRVRLDPNSQALVTIREIATKFPELVPVSAARVLEQADEIQRQRDLEQQARDAAAVAYQTAVRRSRWPEIWEVSVLDERRIPDRTHTVELKAPQYAAQ